jgi:NAD(P)-dependent dehydrogenase (short-subunit alcohol dehydrogenase family)
MMKDFEKIVSGDFLDIFTVPIGRRSTPVEQAMPLVFLNSDAGAFISGACIPVDHGFFGGVTTGAIDMQALLANAPR